MKDNKIKFEKFPNSNKRLNKIKKDKILTVILFVLIIILFIVSGFFNKKLLDYKDSNKKVNTSNIL